MFQGFSMAASEFFWELMFHNERPWFQAHKEEYIRLLRDPFQALAEETLARLQQRLPQKDLRLHVSRIYRDARRLFGRGPYKDHLWFSVKESRHWEEGPAFWFELGTATYSWGTGFYCSEAARMESWRRYIDENTPAVERLARRLKRQGGYVLEGEEYKRPKADRGELLNPWYNRKWIGLVTTRDFGGELLTAELPEKLAEEYEKIAPYYELFAKAFEE